MTDEQISELLATVREIKATMATKADVENLHGKVDHIVDNMATRDDQERAKHQLERHEHWIQQLAEKLDIKLSY